MGSGPDLGHFPSLGRVPAGASGREHRLAQAPLELLIERLVAVLPDLDPATDTAEVFDRLAHVCGLALEEVDDRVRERVRVWPVGHEEVGEAGGDEPEICLR